MPLLPAVRRTLALGALAGTGLATYAAWEARQYTLRHVTLPLLPAGHATSTLQLPATFASGASSVSMSR